MGKRAEKPEAKKEEGGTFAKVVDILAAVRLFFAELRESILERVDGALRRTLILLTLYLWVSVGVVLMLVGLFDLLIDQAGLPRGVVYSLGGLLVCLVSVIALQSMRVGRGRK